MKFLLATILLSFGITMLAEAQFRQDLNRDINDYSATVSHTQSNTVGSWMNMLNMTMSHSYSMTFSNFGGQMQNLNAYTNHMFFDVSDRIDAQLDVSVLHAPFGNSFMSPDNSLGTQIIIDQARIDFRPSENTRISVQFSQRPYYSTFGPYGFGNHHSLHNRRSSWY